jgi:hypothetical protein
MIRRIGSWFKRRSGSDKRNRSRVDIGFPAFIEVGDVITPVTTENLSMNGALCTGADSFIEGEACQLIIPVAGGIRIAVEGLVVRSDGESTAIRFTGMDPESFTHLRRMVELNAHDPDRIERELRGEKTTPPESRKS